MSNPNTDQSHFSQFHSNSNINQNINILPVTENSGKLKVEDALKYIDRVKSRFKEDVYKKFLEVMKDFKAQKINTESVIQNVLTLFHGHQDLIEGFNTFLPPGYQMSTYQWQSVSNFNHAALQPTINVSQPVINTQHCTILPNSNVIMTHTELPIKPNNSIAVDQIGFIAKEKVEVTQIQHVPSGSAPYLNLKSISTGIPQTPTEFNHAVEYVNKIKNRFQKQPDVYKRFLEILHWYQKEQKNPDLAKRKQTEAEVSQEVAKLFDNEHDLLAEFSTFLPDSTDEVCQTRKQSITGSYKASSLTASNQPYFINAANTAPINLAALNERSNSINQVHNNSTPTPVINNNLVSGANKYPSKIEPVINTHHNTNSDYSEKDTNLIQSNNPSNINVTEYIRPNQQYMPTNLSSIVSSSAANINITNNQCVGSKRNLVQDTPSNTTSNNIASSSSVSHPPNKRLRTASTTNNNNSSNSAKDNIKTNLKNTNEFKNSRFFDQINAMCLELLEYPGELGYNTFINLLNLFNKRLIGTDELKNTIKPFFSKRSSVWINFLKILDRINENEKVFADGGNHGNSAYNYNSRIISSNSNTNYTNMPEASVLSDRQIHHHNTTNSQSNSFTATHKVTPPNNTNPASVSSNTNVFCRKNIELSKLELCGSNYRVLPEELTEQRSKIQQQNRICKEVLNYNFLCHRSLSTEDGAFVFSKKNHFEESVFKIEDERYEIDMVMEVNKAAMVKLADLQVRLKNMTGEQLKDFNLEESLYKSSSILFYKAIQRIYGDKSSDIINSLKHHPTLVVPIVLGRLKEKDAEWKEKIKQFRRQWRDQDQFLLKSLDYQAINFRTKDATYTRPKSLLNCLEINSKMKPLYLNNYEDQTVFSRLIQSLIDIKRTWKFERPDKWGSYAFNHNTNFFTGSTTATTNTNSSFNNTNNNTVTNNSNTNATNTNNNNVSNNNSILGNTNNYGVIELLNHSPGTALNCINYHLLLLFPCDVQYAKSILDLPFQSKKYLFDKLEWLDLLSDASSLVIHHLKRQSNFSKDDKTNMKNLMRVTIQDFFIDERFPMSDDEEDTNSGNNADSDHSGASNNSQPPISKSALSININTDTNVTKTKLASNFDNHNHYKLLLGNRSWYVFIRLYHILVDRLAALKIKAEQIKSMHQDDRNQNNHEVADLLLYKKSNQLSPDEYYQEAISLVKDLLDSCEDTVNFEDKLREMFGIHAYIWFSMDKLITTLVKQLQTVSCTDAYSRKLTALFKQCSKPFYGQDDRDNILKINNMGTGSSNEARGTSSNNPNISLITDEFSYFQAATRLANAYKEPLVLLMFHRCPSDTNNEALKTKRSNGFLSVTMLDIPPPPQSDDDDDDDDEEGDGDEEDENNDDNTSGERRGKKMKSRNNKECHDDEDLEEEEYNNRRGDNNNNNNSNINHFNNEEHDNCVLEAINNNNVPNDNRNTNNLPNSFNDINNDNDRLSNRNYNKKKKKILKQLITKIVDGCPTPSIKQEQLTNTKTDSVLYDDVPISSWRRYVQRYVNCNEQLGLIDGLSNLELDKRIVVPIFLLRSLRKSIMAISCGQRTFRGISTSNVNVLSDSHINANNIIDNDVNATMNGVAKLSENSELKVESETVIIQKSTEDIDEEMNERKESLTDSCDTKLIINEEQLSEHHLMSLKDQQNSEWHNVIVTLITSIFPESDRDKLSKFLHSTVITGHMCPASDDNGNNVMTQFETSKLTWSVGSNGIFHHNKSDNEISVQDRTRKTMIQRRDRFQRFLDTWLSKQ